MKKNIKRKGFTLIELIVVIAILGILAAVMIPRFGGFQDKATSSQALVNAKQVATALDGIMAEGKKYDEARVAGDGTKFNTADIVQIAGTDIAVAEITGLTVDKRGFTYKKVIGGKTFTVIRGEDGKFTVTY